MRHLLPTLFVAALLTLAPAAPADAIQFANSSTTGKSVVIVPIRTGGDVVGPLGYTLGLRFIPSPGDVLGPASLGTGVKEGFSYMGDIDFALRYKYTIADIQFLGRFNPSISPFLGYRFLGAGTSADLASSALASGGVSGGTSYLHGLHYGVGAETELPLGFSGFAHGGLTTLMGGGWNAKHVGLTGSSDTSGSIAPGGATLPLFGFGASWHLGPVFRIAVGWDIFALPTNMRAQAATLAPGNTWVNGFSVGVTLLGFSI